MYSLLRSFVSLHTLKIGDFHCNSAVCFNYRVNLKLYTFQVSLNQNSVTMDALKLACNDQRTIMTCVNVFILYRTLISTKIDQSSQTGNLLPHKLWYIH